jgi:hypothetical protein
MPVQASIKGKTQQAGVKPGTVGIQTGAQGSRATQRNARVTNEPGAKYTGKALKGAVADWLKSARAASKGLDEGLKALKIAKDAGNADFAALCEQACQLFLERLLDLALTGKDLAEQVQAEPAADGEHETPGATGATGEIAPANATAGALDSGSRAVLDHVMSIGEIGTPGNPYILDAARMEATRKRANAIHGAINPTRVLFGMDDDVLTDYSQLSFMRDRAAK